MSVPFASYQEPTVIEVRAPWCHSCRAMQPLIDATAADYAGTVQLVVVDASREPETVRELGVLGTPTLIAIRAGTEVGRITGSRSASELRELFDAAATGEEAAISGSGLADRRLRVLAGVALVVLGLLTGPAWVLTGVGGGVLAWGLGGAWRGRRPRLGGSR